MNDNAEKIDVIGAIELAAIDAASAAKRHNELGQKIAAGVTSLQALELHKVSGAVAELIAAAEVFRGVTSGDDAGDSGREACARLDAALAGIAANSGIKPTR